MDGGGAKVGPLGDGIGNYFVPLVELGVGDSRVGEACVEFGYDDLSECEAYLGDAETAVFDTRGETHDGAIHF